MADQTGSETNIFIYQRRHPREGSIDFSVMRLVPIVRGACLALGELTL
jgi:hypothetical protein